MFIILKYMPDCISGTISSMLFFAALLFHNDIASGPF